MREPVDIADDVQIGPFSFIRENTRIGAGTRIGDHAQLMGDCVIGRDCRLHSNVHISKGMQVGDRVFIGPHFVCANVKFPRPTRPEFLRTEGCIIEDDVKIGSGVTVLPGVRIGHDSLVGAGAVVTKDAPPYAIVVGNPARVVGDVRALEAYK